MKNYLTQSSKSYYSFMFFIAFAFEGQVHVFAGQVKIVFVCLFVLLLYVPSQQLWSLRDGPFT